MEACNHRAVMLPDIETFGGDTQPWVISVVHENGTPYTVAEISEYLCTLTLTPFTVTNVYAESVEPVLVKDGAISSDDAGGAVMIFEFDKSDTMYLSGKFTYQVAFALGSDKLRVGQGKLILHPNIDRGG